MKHALRSGATILRLALAGAAIALLLTQGATAVIACSSEMPTFEYVLENASAIARVTVLEGRDADLSETFRVDQVLKGRTGDTIVLQPARSGLCGDTVAFFIGAEGGKVGQTAILALDVPYFDQVIHPVWGVIEGRLGGSAHLPDGVHSLPELERAIAAAVAVPPPTEADDAAPKLALDSWVLAALTLLSAGALFGGLLRFRRAKSANEPND